MNECCKRSFLWNGTPSGREEKLAELDVYVSGEKKDNAVLICHDALGWKMNNTRLLADHFAKEAGVTVYIPDFFHGTAIKEEDIDMIKKGDSYELYTNPKFDWDNWYKTNWPDVRMPEILQTIRLIREQHKWIAAVGYCWGGLTNFKLASKGVVDCVTIAHPGAPTEDEIKAIKVPVQILAPEHDFSFTPELKEFCNREIPKLGVDYVYHHFPGLPHGFATKCDENSPYEKKQLEVAKNAVVFWILNHAP